MADARIRYPIKFAATSYVLRVTCNAVTTDLTFPTSGSLTVGRCYWVSGDSQPDEAGDENGIGDLLRILGECLEAHAQITKANARYLEASNRIQVRVSSSSNPVTLDWGHANTTLDASIFGFFSEFTATTAADVVTAGLPPKGIWNPGRAIATDSRPRQAVVGGVSTALSGKQRTSRISVPNKEREIDIRFLNQSVILDEYADVITGAERGTEITLENAWTNSLSKGETFRVHDDESKLDYGAYRMRSLDYPANRNEQYSYWWDASFQMNEQRAPGYHINYSAEFDGVDDYVTLTSTIFNAQTSFAISFWFKKDAALANEVMFSQWGSSQNCISIDHRSDAKVRISIASGLTDSSNYFETSASANRDDWHHVAVSYDGSQSTNASKLLTWVDGALETGTFTGTIPTVTTTSSTAVRIAAEAGGVYFGAGNIADVVFSNGVTMTTAVAQQIYNNGRGSDPRILETGSQELPDYWAKFENTYRNAGHLPNDFAAVNETTLVADVPF